MIVEQDFDPEEQYVLVTGTESLCEVQTAHESESESEVQDPQLLVLTGVVVVDFLGSHVFHELDVEVVVDFLGSQAFQSEFPLRSVVLVGRALQLWVDEML